MTVETISNMALVIAIVALVFAVAAYWRSGGRRDIEALRRELQADIDALRRREAELVEGTSRALASAYEASRQRLAAAREALQRELVEAATGVAERIRRAQEQLDALSERLSQAARSAKETTIAVAQEVEQGLATRVRRLEARVALLRSENKTSRALLAAERQDFEAADRLLHEATDLLGEARTHLGADYDVGAVKAALHDAAIAVKARAANVRTTIERVLSDTQQLVTNLEAAEGRAAR